MHPAISVIFFTTASGAGYGMLALIGILSVLGLLPEGRCFGGVAIALALGLVSAGLLSSMFHLGHPERAWRALSQWRSSWLSREGVLAILTYGPAFMFALGWVYFGNLTGIWALSGVVLSVMAMVTVFSTSMIYASLKSIPEWYHRLVPPVYLIMGLATGGVLLLLVMAIFASTTQSLAIVTLVTFTLGLVAKILYWQSIDQASPESSTGSATGLGRIGKVRQLEAPHTGDNWVMREMGFVVARKHAQKLRRLVISVGFLIPMVSLIMLSANVGSDLFWAGLAVISASVGVVIERWLFFAEAHHVVGLFYSREV